MNKILSEIRKNIALHADRTALMDTQGSSLTYGELDLLARRIAARLIKLGVKPGSFVTVELPRSIEYIAAQLGVWYAGAAYAPLSDEYPEDRLAYIREDCSAAAVINEKFMRGIELEQPISEAVACEESSPAVLIYTSGSTGKPKGVLHDFLSVSEAVSRYSKLMDFEGDSVQTIGTALTFVASLLLTVAPLAAGITALLLPFDVMRDPVLLSDCIKNFGVTHAFISPKMLRMFECKGSRLKCVFVAGERVSNVYSDDYKIICAYGQTETAGTVTAFVIDKPYENTPIGKAVDGVSAYILDEDGNETPEGELCVAGHFASGYLADEG